VAVCALEGKEDEEGPSDAGKGALEASIAIASIELNRHEGRLIRFKDSIL
jgi:hypothetical protein